jgi:Na+-driven multidrug efflux pump
MTIDAPLDAPPMDLAANSLVTSPILPTLLRLALPNAVAMFGSTLVAVAETSYIGRLGIEPLAGIALVFPFVMLTQMMSAGAMGGGVSSAISRALGAGNRDRAATLALHAAIIGVCGGIFFTVMMLLFGRQLFSLLGGRDGVLEQACNYSGVLPAIPASPPRPIPISPGPGRRSDSSAWGFASILLRKALRKSEVRRWREPSDC